jgi:signal transduction histidine kinase
MPARLYFLGAGSRTLVAALAVVLAALEIYVDWQTWIQLNMSIVYTLPLVVAAAARNRRLIWLLAFVLLTATFVVYAVQVPPGNFTLHEPFFVNRVLASVTLLLSASLLHALTLAADALSNRGVEAEQASTRKSRLLASVSHDIRTPLTTINVMADLIRHTADDPALAARVPELVRTLQTSALSMSDMVADVLDISAIDSGRVAVHASEFVLDELLAQELQGFEPLARAKGLRLQLRQAQAPICLRSDKVKLGRVVRNLLMNAIKFTDAGGVTVASEVVPDRAVLISVADTGIGIAEENLGRIFGEFAQLRAPSADDKRGWGLGLAISKRLVEMMGGAISVESSVNAGSTFTVRFPPAFVLQHLPSAEPVKD